MPTQSDIVNTPLSNLNHIDALLDSGPDWNYLTPVGNVMYYTFSISSGNEVYEGAPVVGQQQFSIGQVLDSLDGPATVNGSMADLGFAMGVPADIDAGIMLVGVPQADAFSMMA